MNRTERLTERAISFAIAETDEDLAVARLVFLAQGDYAALDAAIDACLARTERTLYIRWRAISLLVRVRYEDRPTPAAPAAPSSGRSSSGKGRAPRSSRGPELRQPSGLERFLWMPNPGVGRCKGLSTGLKATCNHTNGPTLVDALRGCTLLQRS